MKLFHGSLVRVEYPDVTIGRDSLDFGRGFYMTRDYEQAVRWTNILVKRDPSGVRTINTFELTDDAFEKYNYRLFESYNDEWLDFIVSNRLGGEDWRNYDIIEGGIANDKVFDTIEIYMSGMIPKDVAIGRLKNEKIRNQLCIVSQDVVNDCLKYVESIIIE